MKCYNTPGTLFLAFYTKYSAAASQFSVLQKRLTLYTGLTTAAIDFKFILKAAALAIGIAIVANGAALGLYAFLQHLHNKMVQGGKFCGAKIRRRGIGPDTRPEQRFIGVNIANTRDNSLVQQ